MLFLGPGIRCQVRQQFNDLRIVTGQSRQQFVAYFVPQMDGRAIRFVLAPRLPERVQIRLDLGPPRSKQRTDTHSGALATGPRASQRKDRMNTAQSLRPRTSQHLHQHRLGLVVERVGGGDLIRRARRKQAAKGFIAQMSRCLLNTLLPLRGALSGIHRNRLKGNAKRMRQRGGECRVLQRGFSPQSMLYMQDAHHQTKLRAAGVERAQQRR